MGILLKTEALNKSFGGVIALKDIDLESLFEPFSRTTGSITVIRDDFEKLDAFLQVVGENGVSTETIGLQELLNTAGNPKDAVCFHAAEDKDGTVQAVFT